MQKWISTLAMVGGVLNLMAEGVMSAPGTQPTAAALIQGVQESELWFDKLTSFHLHCDSHWTHTQAGVESYRRELKQQFPELKPTTREFIGLAAESADSFDLFASPDHFRKEVADAQRREVHVWDGKRQLDYELQQNGHERYGISDKPYVAEYFLLALNWGRMADHHNWWRSDRDHQHTDLSQYTYMGEATYRGINCHVVTVENDTIFYIGVDDHLLHGQKRLASGGPFIESWLEDYRELAPGCVFPMKQGYSLYDAKSADHHLDSTHEMRFTVFELNPKLDTSLFTLEMHDGAKVDDMIRNISYVQKKDRTPTEWQKILGERDAQNADMKVKVDAEDALIGKAASPFAKEAEWINSEKRLTWEDLKGKVVLVDFFADWCGPCRNDLPGLADLHRQSKENGITVIAIHPAGSPRASIDKVLKDFGLTYPICIDIADPASASWGMLYSQYHIYGIPHAFVVDRKGNIAGHGSVAEALGIARKLAEE